MSKMSVHNASIEYLTLIVYKTSTSLLTIKTLKAQLPDKIPSAQRQSMSDACAELGMTF